MKFSKATNYALHTMLLMLEASPIKPIGVQQMAETQGVSPTYLSKILTKLVKAGLIESASGAGGGYRLLRARNDISFLDIIHAIEGTTSLFQCAFVHGEECAIQGIMKEAEQKMELHLRQARLVDLVRA